MIKIFIQCYQILTIIKILIDEVQYILENTDKKCNRFADNVIKYTVMRIANEKDIIELYK